MQLSFIGEGIMVDNERFGRLEGKIDAICEDLSEIKKLLYGNGQPGLLDKTIRTDESMRTLVATVNKLAETVSAHVKQPHTLKEMVLNKTILAWIVVAFVLLHSILPPDLSIFEIIKNWLGL